MSICSFCRAPAPFCYKEVCTYNSSTSYDAVVALQRECFVIEGVVSFMVFIRVEIANVMRRCAEKKKYQTGQSKRTGLATNVQASNFERIGKLMQKGRF